MTIPAPRRLIKAGIDRLPIQPYLARHQHHEAYVTVVLRGTYEQTSYAGRFTIGAGDVILQPTFDCHSDKMLSDGLDLIRLPWQREVGLGGVFDDLPIDEIRRAAETDVWEAAALVRELTCRRQPRHFKATHRADLLREALLKSPKLRIGDWSEQFGFAPASMTRSFQSLYGISPTRYRNEVRARAAWARLVSSQEAMTTIAYDLGFADQSHMTREVKSLTAKTPSAWRLVSRTTDCVLSHSAVSPLATNFAAIQPSADQTDPR